MAFIYAQQSYETKAQVEAAVVAFKNRLDNNPTDWVTVKLLGGNAVDGWVVPTQELNDTDINTISGDEFYSVSEVYGGNTWTGLSSSQVTEKVLEARKAYATWMQANTINETYAPTNEDMSNYVFD